MKIRLWFNGSIMDSPSESAECSKTRNSVSIFPALCFVATSTPLVVSVTASDAVGYVLPAVPHLIIYWWFSLLLLLLLFPLLSLLLLTEKWTWRKDRPRPLVREGARIGQDIWCKTVNKYLRFLRWWCKNPVRTSQETHYLPRYRAQPVNAM
jgi:hypothetical protein